MKMPTGQPVMQHQFNVTFNGNPVEGLTEWIDDVSLDYIGETIGLSFMLVHDDNGTNRMSHHKLQEVLDAMDSTLEIYFLHPNGEVVCKEVFDRLSLKELSLGLNACVVSGGNETALDDPDVQENIRPRRASLFDNPVYVQATVGYGEKKYE